jgi:hypothetical protein
VITALVIGTLLAVGALAFVLYPIFFGVPRAPTRVAPTPPAEEDQSTAVAALREIEFDRATGKLSDADYTDLKTRYTREAIAAMRRDDVARGTPIPDAARPTDDEVEAVVRAYREQQVRCPSCGPRPEPDAIFCSDCGRFLRESCAGCGAPVDAADARFCVHCGNRLAA